MGDSVSEQHCRIERVFKLPIPENTRVLPDGKPLTCVSTTLILSYTKEYQPPNGTPGKACERIALDYDEWPILNPNCFANPLFTNLRATKLIIENGKVLEPQQEQAIHVLNLDERVVDALKDIPHADVQEALGRAIRCYQPLTSQDIAVKEGLRTCKDRICGVLKFAERGTVTYFIGIKSGEGLTVAPHVSAVRERLEQQPGAARVVDRSERDYRLRKRQLDDGKMPYALFL